MLQISHEKNEGLKFFNVMSAKDSMPLKSTLELFKVQLSLTSSSGVRLMLVYNRTRDILVQIPADKEALQTIGTQAKSYWYGRLNHIDHTLELFEQIRENQWPSW